MHGGKNGLWSCNAYFDDSISSASGNDAPIASCCEGKDRPIVAHQSTHVHEPGDREEREGRECDGSTYGQGHIREGRRKGGRGRGGGEKGG